jgi:hypothetical protein
MAGGREVAQLEIREVLSPGFQQSLLLLLALAEGSHQVDKGISASTVATHILR